MLSKREKKRARKRKRERKRVRERGRERVRAFHDKCKRFSIFLSLSTENPDFPI